MNLYEILKKNLILLRKEKSLTQQELSDKIEIARANIGRYETGENVPPLDVIVKYADFFDVSLDELFDRIK